MILVALGEFPDDWLDELSVRIGLPCGPSWVDPKIAWNPNREQYDSTRLLAELRTLYDDRVVAVTNCDLYIPVLTFVFGEADMPGRAALVSLHRLRDEFYGLPPNPGLLRERTVRELRHEIGHVFGLAHCRDAACVMSSSHSVERVDSKTEWYCPSCSAFLDKQPGFPPTFVRPQRFRGIAL